MSRYVRCVVIGVVCLASVTLGFTQTLPRVFSDNMVLPSGQPVPVWGWAEPGESITLRFAGQEKRATVGEDGRWDVRLEPLSVSSEPAELIVTGRKALTLRNVLVGEVWLCSGQSNMEKPVGEQRGQKPTLNHEEELRSAKYPQLRLLKVGRARSSTAARDVDGEWVVCSPENLDRSKFSAAGYFFARRLHTELGIPIGIIDASFGGSLIESWIPPAGFAEAPSLIQWERASATPGSKVTIFQGATKMEVEPATMFKGMIAPLVPFPVRGVLWYQGESNVYAGDGAIYADKMRALIVGWRGAWMRELPFFYVQLAPLLYHVTRSNMVVSPEAVPLLWEAQTATMQLPQTGMIVTTDLVDDLTDIHPRNKKDIGERLARWALAKCYGRTEIVFSGPLFHRLEVHGDKATVHFEHVGEGLISKDQRPLNWFTVAGPDGVFFPASASIHGETVVVSSPRVPSPTVVRFAWDEAARPNLINRAGLPAVPFRTDNPFDRPSLGR